MNLYEEVSNAIADARVSALIVEEVLEPAQGPNAAICPPTYAKERREDKAPRYASAEKSPIPAPASSGWHHAWAMRGDDPRLGTRVIVNSLGACADSAETGLYRNQERLGLAFPAFVVAGAEASEQQIASALKAVKKTVDPTAYQQIKQALQLRVSHWELAHRTADSWLMFAAEPGGTGQVWAGNGPVKQILLNISHESGMTVYRNAPNCALFGTWLSAGTARRHAIPRAYSCEVTGYGATEVVRGATKLDRAGGASNESRMQVSANSLAVAQTGGKPSVFGFGQVPDLPQPRGFQFELILREAAISLKALSRFSYGEDAGAAKAQAARRVYVLMGIVGHLLAQEDSFLRSGCDLISVEERWGWRTHGSRQPLEMDTPSLKYAAEALRYAVQEAAQVGLQFAEPTELALSDAQIGLIVQRVVDESAVKAAKEDS